MTNEELIGLLKQRLVLPDHIVRGVFTELSELGYSVAEPPLAPPPDSE